MSDRMSKACIHGDDPLVCISCEMLRRRPDKKAPPGVSQPVAELIRIQLDGKGKTEEFACINVGERDGYRAREGVTVLSREPLYLTNDSIDDILRTLNRKSEQSNDLWRKGLSVHWLSNLECDHVRKLDTASCACGWSDQTPRLTVGTAVKAWISHVTEQVDAMLPVEVMHEDEES
jgi:hypothetical protein